MSRNLTGLLFSNYRTCSTTHDCARKLIRRFPIHARFGPKKGIEDKLDISSWNRLWEFRESFLPEFPECLIGSDDESAGIIENWEHA